MIQLDTRDFSRHAFNALKFLTTEIAADKHKKASAIVQNLPSYISTWSLHRLAGDAIKSKGETAYKGIVYKTFLANLKTISQVEFNPQDPDTLLNSKTLKTKQYLGLNRLAIELAREWSFWATAVLGEAEE